MPDWTLHDVLGERSFPTRLEAVAVARWHQAFQPPEERDFVRVFKCRECGQWHFGRHRFALSLLASDGPGERLMLNPEGRVVEAW